MKINIVANKGDVRIDKYLSEILEYSRSEISRNIKNSNILVNKEQIKPSHILSIGDKIEGTIVEKTINLSKLDMDLDIIYEDDYLLAINKPYDLLVHPALSSQEPSLVNALLPYTSSLSDLAGDDRPGIVHRLDKDTTGIILVAKDNIVHEKLSNLFKNRQIKKTYLAIVHGEIYDSGLVDAPIARDPNNRTRMAVDHDFHKQAITKYKPIKAKNNYSLVEIDLITGRTHQIRVHMNYINHEILADKSYGRKKEFIKAKHHMLHAYRLQFIHPISGDYMDLIARPDRYFIETMEKIGFKRKED